MRFRRVLAIETSCDDTSVAIVEAEGTVLSLVSANQDMAHQPFGGIVPEIASRNHTMHLLPLIESCISKSGLNWTDIDGMAVTNRPGLIGSLIVGVVTAKSLAFTFKKPLIGINHLEGHLLAPFLRDETFAPPKTFQFPYVALAVSGGHTQLYWVKGPGEYEVIGRTVDDAAGEAFDKFAKLIGLGFPGGQAVDLLAEKGNPNRISFPRPLIFEKHLNMSFSGLKTAAQNLLQSMNATELSAQKADICASYQEAVVDSLMAKLDRACTERASVRAIITGGVSANSRLRNKAFKWSEQTGIQVVIPPLRYCTDNAAMIGYAGILRLNRGEMADLSLSPSPRSWPDDFSGGVSR
jgi:N6-L-threonylcarbamoyladenine synthase